jgi:hypothetical protein
MTGSKRVYHWTSGTVYECREIAGSLQGSPPQQPTMSVVKLEGGSAASVKLGEKSYVRSSGIITLLVRQPIVTIRDEARLRRGHNDQSCKGYQCRETTLTGESRFHISTPLGIELYSLMTGSKRVDHWTSGTVCECSEIAGSQQSAEYPVLVFFCFQPNETHPCAHFMF